jgi:heme exporter protein C
MSEEMKSSWAATLVVAALLGIAGYAALFLAPGERTMGLIQRIFYFHVPSAWTAFIAFFICFVANVAYLLRRAPHWDWLSVSAAEVGLAFCTAVLVTGPIWAKPVWGIWWTWDARLTSTFVLWVLYASYLLLRTLVADPERRAVVSAVFGIFAFLDVPHVYLSIRLWRTQHPQPVIAGGTGSGLDPPMWRVFLICWAALLGLMVLLVRQRYRLEALRHEVQELSVEAELRGPRREASPGQQVGQAKEAR